MFVGFHALLADRTGNPELALTIEEGDGFMLAVKNVMRHYAVETTQKTTDFIALFGCIGAIYGPRIYMMRQRREEADGQHHGSNVFPLPLSPNGG